MLHEPRTSSDIITLPGRRCMQKGFALFIGGSTDGMTPKQLKLAWHTGHCLHNVKEMPSVCHGMQQHHLHLPVMYQSVCKTPCCQLTSYSLQTVQLHIFSPLRVLYAGSEPLAKPHELAWCSWLPIL